MNGLYEKKKIFGKKLKYLIETNRKREDENYEIIKQKISFFFCHLIIIVIRVAINSTPTTKNTIKKDQFDLII